jgi:maltooligosyltrehalose trehalohydrolase
MPIGAEVCGTGGVHFRVWAPRRERASVLLEGNGKRKARSFALDRDQQGYFTGFVPKARAGMLYRFELDGTKSYPDPASRFQPQGPEGPSQVVDPSSFRWTDREWRGVELQGQVIYEMHVGTYTREGTWKAAARHLPELADLGITLIELMPVSEFAGGFGWGYDGVDLFAPYHGYGEPDEFRYFVNKAHNAGIGVILDVVYNHFGPVGNFMSEFSLDYFTDRYETEWGYAINFDGRNCGPVREFFVCNAAYWIEEYHVDGLRLDATQAINDQSPEHVITELTRRTREKAGKRSILVIAENEPQDTRLLRKPEDGGMGLDAVWNDDFHHSAMVSLTGHKEAYYSDYSGTPQEFISAAKWGYLFQGQYYSWQKKCRGRPGLDIEPRAFINFLENHDQVANSGTGARLHFRSHPGALRAVTAFMLLIPGTPLLFQGQEFFSSSPFCYFADHKPDLAERVKKGRAEFLSQFGSLQDPGARRLMADPSSPATFRSSKLDLRERKRNPQALSLHRDLLRLRREDAVFSAQRRDWMHGAIVAPGVFLIRYLGGDKGDRLIVTNLERDRCLLPASEPLLAPPADTHWDVLWSSENPVYGGGGTPPVETEGEWVMPGCATIVFAPQKVVRLEYV